MDLLFNMENLLGNKKLVLKVCTQFTRSFVTSNGSHFEPAELQTCTASYYLWLAEQLYFKNLLYHLDNYW